MVWILTKEMKEVGLVFLRIKNEHLMFRRIKNKKPLNLYSAQRDDEACTNREVLKGVCENRDAYVIKETLEECGKRIFEIIRKCLSRLYK